MNFINMSSILTTQAESLSLTKNLIRIKRAIADTPRALSRRRWRPSQPNLAHFAIKTPRNSLPYLDFCPIPVHRNGPPTPLIQEQRCRWSGGNGFSRRNETAAMGFPPGSIAIAAPTGRTSVKARFSEAVTSLQVLSSLYRARAPSPTNPSPTLVGYPRCWWKWAV